MASGTSADVCARALSVTSLTERALTWTTINSIIDTPGFAEDVPVLQEVCKCVIETAPRYTDKASQRLVDRAVEKACKHDVFVKSLAGVIVQSAEKAFLDAGQSLVLLRWSCEVIQNLDLEKAKKPVTRLVLVQARLLLNIDRAKVKSGSKAFIQLLQRKPELFDLCVEVVKEAAAGANLSALTSGLLQYTALPNNAAKLSDNRAVFIAAYLKIAFDPKVTPPPAAVEAFSPLVALLTHDEFSGSVLPTLKKMFMRSPEVVAGAAASLFTHATIDLSKYMSEVSPALWTLSRAAKEESRQAAHSMLRPLAAQCTNTDAIAEALDTVQGILKGSEGKLTQPTQRQGMIQAILALCSVPGKGRSMSEVAAKAVEVCVVAYKAEQNEEVKLAALAAARAWLPRCSALPPPFADLAPAALKDKEPVRRAFLGVLLHAVSASAEAGYGAAALVEALKAQLAAAVAKPAQRVEGLLSLGSLVLVAALDSSAEAALFGDALWPAALAADSSMLGAGTLAKLVPADCAALAATLEPLLCQNFPQVEKVSGGLEAVGRLAVALLVHPASAPRRAAAAALVKCLQTGPRDAGAVPALLLGGMGHWVEAAEAVAQRSAEGAEAADPFAGAPPARLAAALHTCVPPSLAAHEAPRLLLLAHHPCVAGTHAKRPGHVWDAVLGKILAVNPAFMGQLAGASRALAEALLGPEGLASPAPATRTAALRSIASLMRHMPHQFLPHLTAVVEEVADPAEHDALTEMDVKIYYTPPTMVAYDPALDVEGQPKQGSAKISGDGNALVVRVAAREAVLAERARSGSAAGARGPAAMGRAPARPSAAAAKGPPASEKKDPREEMRQSQLQEEAVRRAKVVDIVQRLSLGLEALEAAVASNPEHCHEESGRLARLPTHLLSSPLVGETRALKCMQALATCCAHPLLSSHSHTLACALRLVARRVSGTPASIVRAVSLISRAARSRGGALPSATYCLVFPIISHVLLGAAGPGEPATLQAANDLLAMHISREFEFPRLQTIPLLLRLMDRNGPKTTQATLLPFLQDCCAGLEEAEVEAVMEGLQAEAAHVRAAVLAALPDLPCVAEVRLPMTAAVLCRLFLAMHDAEEHIAATAADLWARCGCAAALPSAAPALLPFFGHPSAVVRLAASKAYPEAMRQAPEAASLGALTELFWASREPLARASVAAALKHAADCMQARHLPAVSSFLIRAMADPHEAVRAAVLDAGREVLDAHGAAHVGMLLPAVEGYLDQQAAQARTVAEEIVADRVKEGLAVFLGTLARHLQQGDPKLRAILQRLLEVLRTPSESVQKGVANCLPGLVPVLAPEEKAELVSTLLSTVLKAEKFGDRQGAAFGLAGAVKGVGMSAIKAHGIMDALKEAVEDKSSAIGREGALLAFEALCSRLGRLFEPYVVHILPMLLVCFGDPQAEVREATDRAAKAVMAQLSGQGVKLVLPALLKGLEDRIWRTKQGSVQLLAAMAHCAPKQLGTCLPTIVPRLSEVLNDTHPKVQAAAGLALQQVGAVIRNPEVQLLVPTLLQAITRPNDHTKACLDTLLDTVFVNTIDAASLALIVPVLNRALRERYTDVKKKAAKIVGNMSALINEPKDMVPYVPLLLPELKKVLVDPSPEVRAIAAKALGSLLEGMGAESFPDLVPWLMETLRADTSSVERAGAAQGLAEVLCVLGMDQVEVLLPEIVQGCSHADVAVRNGHISLMRHLPLTLGMEFQNHLQVVLPCVLDGLADENESVRDASLGAGRVIVDQYALTSMDLLLPAIEDGIMNPNWRIRQASVELLGDLLFKICGTSGKVVVDGGSDDEGVSTESQGRAILEALGLHRRNQILAAVYMARSDVALIVRNCAVHVWKTVVANTPRTLREILTVLTQRVIASLAAEETDQLQTAARCLGELVRKLGDILLQEILPILREGLEENDSSLRQGVCLGLSEVLGNASRQQLHDHMEALIPAVRAALCDSNPAVCEAAGEAFDTLYRAAGGEVTSDIVPALLAELETNTYALDGLKQVLAKQPKILPTVLPRLAASPMTAFRARALASLASVVGPALHPHLPVLLAALLPAMYSGDPEADAAATEAAEAIAVAVEEGAVHLLVGELNRGVADPDPKIRAGSAALAGLFAKGSPSDLSPYLPGLVSLTVAMFIDQDEQTLKAAWKACAQIVETIPKEDLPNYVRAVRESIADCVQREGRRQRHAGAAAGEDVVLPALRLPKALSPVVPVFLQGVLQAGLAGEVREAAVEGLGELVAATDEDALKPFVIQITGPLIRIIGDKFTWQVKAAILQSLGIIIRKGGKSLKPFLPQLQTTFIKCLHDGANTVRRRAARSLGLLMQLQPRVDPLVNELLGGLRTAAGGVREAMLHALRAALSNAGQAVSPAVHAAAGEALQGLLEDSDEAMREAAARALGRWAVHAPEDGLAALLQNHVGAAATAGHEPDRRYVDAMAVAAVLKHAAPCVLDEGLLQELALGALKCQLADDRVFVRLEGVKGARNLLLHQVRFDLPSATPALAPGLARAMKDEASDVRGAALSLVKTLAKRQWAGTVGPHLALLAPLAVEALADKSNVVAKKAERTVRFLLRLGEDFETAGSFLKSPEGTKVRGKLTDMMQKRLSRLPQDSEESDVSDDDK